MGKDVLTVSGILSDNLMRYLLYFLYFKLFITFPNLLRRFLFLFWSHALL